MGFIPEIDAPVYVLTAAHGERAGGCVVTWVMPASFSSRLVVALSRFNATTALVLQSGRFRLHLLAPEQREEFMLFGTRSGAEVEKFPGFSPTGGPPEIPSSASGLVRVEKWLETPDRYLVYGKIEGVGPAAGPHMRLGQVLGELTEAQRARLDRRMREAQLRDEYQFTNSDPLAYDGRKGFA
jgi:flavin reductase (DIM6/NTAB) family NADH-FMN oxidoreductase RutF